MMTAAGGEAASGPPTDVSHEQALSVLKRTVQFDKLPLIHVHPIVLVPPIVSSSAWRTAHIADIGKPHFHGRSREWYFVAAVSSTHTPTGDPRLFVEPFGLISHDALAYLNRHRQQVWSVPLILCQKYDDVIAPSGFTVYREVAPLHSADTLDRLKAAFDTRMRVVKWLKASGGFQIRRPLSSSDLLFAGVNVDAKRVDTLVYHLLAFALKWVPGAKRLWRECESELLLFKLLLRPQLHAPICDIIGRLPVTASFEVAANAVEAVHDHYVGCLFDRDETLISRELPLMRLAVTYLHELERWDAHRKYEASSNSTRTAQHGLDTLLLCSPQCMKRALAGVAGSAAQQGAVPAHVRRESALYLMKAGFGVKAVTQIMRPKVVIEYDMDSPTETWAGIESGIRQTASILAASKEAHAGPQHVRFAAQSCSAVMEAGLCPFAEPEARNSVLSKNQEDEKRRYVQAKQRCHAQLRATADAIEAACQRDAEGGEPARKRSKSSNSQGGEALRPARRVHAPREWAAGPFMFAKQQATMRGLKVGAGHVDATLQV